MYVYLQLLLIGPVLRGDRRGQTLLGDPILGDPFQRKALLGGRGEVDHRPSPPGHHGPLPKWKLDDGEPLAHLPV